MASKIVVLGREVRLERRRYGTQTYCWAYLVVGDDTVTLGDPWPSITPKRAELEKAVKLALNPPCPFPVGSVVARSDFVDCFGVNQDRVGGLIVERAWLVECDHIPNYWRIAARKPDCVIEGAANAFEADTI